MIKLLLDANLSYRLVKKLSETYSNPTHVTRCGLTQPAKDTEIWQWAKVNNYLIVTNDEDFVNLSVVKGYPPKVIILRTGNQSTSSVAEILINEKINIEKFINQPDIGVVEIY